MFKKLVDEAVIKHVEKAIKNLRDAAMETRDVEDWKWRNILEEKQSDLIRLIKEMEQDASTD